MKLIADMAGEKKFLSGDVLAREGDDGDGMYLVVSGKVRITTIDDKGKTVELSRRATGEHIGEMALLDGYPRSTTVIAAEETECLVMTRWDFTAELKSSNSIALAMLPELSKIIRRLEGENIP